MLLVKTTAQDGQIGWGEAFGFNICQATKFVVDKMIAPLLIGQEVVDITRTTDELQKKLHLFGRNGPVGYAISGIDIALWDLKGKVEQKSLTNLLRSGDPSSGASKLKAYASLLRYGKTEPLSASVMRATRGGYQAIKVHETDVACIGAARAAMERGTPLMVDTNCPWNLQEAKAASAAMEEFDIHWLEEPIWPPEDQEAQVQLRSSSRIPLALGENAGNVVDFQRIAAAQVADYLQPSVIKCGGVSAMRQIHSICNGSGINFAPHSPYFGPGFLATLHICAALAPDTAVERLYVNLPENIYGDAIDPVEGFFTVPQGPGLGMEPDLRVLEKYLVR